MIMEVAWTNTSNEEEFWDPFSDVGGDLTNVPGRILTQAPFFTFDLLRPEAGLLRPVVGLGA